MSDPTTPTWQITALSTGESIGPDCYTWRSKRSSFSPANQVHSDEFFLINAAASNEAMSGLSAGRALARGENEAG